MNRKAIPYVVLAVMVFFLLFTMAVPAFAVRYMNLTTSRVGGSWYPMGETLSRMVSKYVADVKMNATTSSGGIENIRRLRQKSADLGFVTHNAVYEAYKGVGVFEGKPYKALRLLFNIPGAHLQLLTMRNSGMKSIADFKGKRIGDGSGGSAIPGAIDSLLEVYGMTRKDIKAVPMSRRDRAKAFTDGNLDASFFLIGKGAALMREMTSVHDVVFIDIPVEKVKQIQKKKPYWSPGVIDKSVYPKQLKTDYRTMAMSTSCCVDASMSEDLVYNIVKAIWGHYDEVVEMFAYFGKYTTKNDPIPVTSGVPIHPGAERYYRETGMLK